MPKVAIRTLALVLVALAPLPALAQQHVTRTGLGIDVKAAPIFVSLSQGNANWESRKGVIGGVSVGSHRQGTFDVIAEALYARRGASNLGTNANLNVLEIPVLVRITVAGSAAHDLCVYGLAGQALDVNLRTAQQKASLINVVNPNAVFGAGVEIRRVTFEARENIGLRTLAPNTPNLKLRSFGVVVGFRVH